MDERDKVLQNIKIYFAGTDVRRVFMFGSFDRSESSSDSDIDLLMELDRPMGLLKIIKHKLELEDFIQRKVDLLTPEGISPKIRPFIQKDLTLIYENSR